jgi:hypothetical protein
MGYKARRLGTSLLAFIHARAGEANEDQVSPLNVAACRADRPSNDRLGAENFSDCRRSGMHDPMTTPALATDDRTILERQWGNATLEVIGAQRAYAELVSLGVDDDETVVAACLRLWRAEERQRVLSSALDQLEM